MALKSKLATNAHRGKLRGPEFTWVTVRLDRKDTAILDSHKQSLEGQRGGPVSRAETLRYAIRAAQSAIY